MDGMMLTFMVEMGDMPKYMSYNIVDGVREPYLDVTHACDTLDAVQPGHDLQQLGRCRWTLQTFRRPILLGQFAVFARGTNTVS